MANIDPWGDSWPPFLDKLDSDPVQAKAEFVEFSTAFLTTHPPPALRRLEKYATREGMIWEFNERCCADNFKKLRSYRSLGLPFAGWLWVVAANWLSDQWDKYDHAEKVTVAEDDLPRPDGAPSPTEQLPDPGKSPEERARDAERIRIVAAALKRLRPLCVLLLTLESEGYKPREMQKVLEKLGIGNLTNKQISDRLSDCRELLKNLVKGGGAQ